MFCKRSLARLAISLCLLCFPGRRDAGLTLTVGIIFFLVASSCVGQTPELVQETRDAVIEGVDVSVPLYKLFEIAITNDKSYANQYIDITLEAEFVSPSGVETSFWGFYDGDGKDSQSGNVWKLRFMPTELGTWTYTYRWSDDTPGGSGTFECVADGAGKGVLQPYGANPYWFAYNGTDPVFLKSYYVGAAVVSPVDWAATNIYQPLIDQGYNHLQFNQLLPVEWVHTDWWGDSPGEQKKYLFEDNDPTSKMNLDVWHNVEEHIRWLNDRDVGAHLFQGFDGKSLYNHVNWEKLSSSERDFYVRYVCSRLAPFANIAGWNYTWETEGDDSELELMDLLMKYDPWNHLRTYEDERPRRNNYSNPAYTFASVENHGYADRHSSLSHHLATQHGFKGKPVFMAEGNGLWRTCWEATEDTIRQAAWGVVTAGGSFTWDWEVANCMQHVTSDKIFASQAGEYVETLYKVFTQEIAFHRMTPHDDLLSGFSGNAFCLAEVGKQYLVYKESGGPFNLNLVSSTYGVTWIDTKTGLRRDGGKVDGTDASRPFTPPSSDTDWVLLLQRADITE